MTETSPIASTVLISLQSAAPETNARAILGRTLGEKQVEYAASLGCEKAILLSVGDVRPEAIATRLRAEELGLKVLETSGPHGLSNCVRDEERLLVLQQDLLPNWTDWPENAARDGCVAVLPSSAGAEAGFERIDLARAWAGAMILPGVLLQQLLALPEDSETAPALLRIALQARLDEFQLDERHLADGSWALLTHDADRKLIEEKWLAQHVALPASSSASRSLVTRILRKFGAAFLSRPVIAPATLGISIALTAGAVGLSWLGMGAIGFGLIALAALLLEGARGLRELQAIPRRLTGHWFKLYLLIDAAIIACGAMSIEGEWFRQAFAPIVLVAAFHAAPRDAGGWVAVLRDRTLGSIIVGVLAVFGSVEMGLMVASIWFLALNLVQNRDRLG